MAIVRCRSCNKMLNTPLKSGLIKCSQCQTNLAINPGRPITSVWFLFLVVLAAISIYDILFNSDRSADRLLWALFYLLLPIAAYFLIFFLFGARIVEIREEANSLPDTEKVKVGKVAYCPNCSHEIPATVTACPNCGASFIEKDGWRPLASDPLAPPAPQPPLTARDKGTIATVAACFLIWLPVYLFVVRPIINSYLAAYITGYPAMLHLIPLLVVPVVIGIVLSWILKRRADEKAL